MIKKNTFQDKLNFLNVFNEKKTLLKVNKNIMNKY